MAEENNMSQVKEMIPDESCCSALPPTAGSVNLRRYLTGALDKRGGKAQSQTRYRGNQTSSTHDLCKHGKRREDELVIKPWKLVKNKNVEGGETLSLVRKSLQVAKRDVTGADAASEAVKSFDALRAKRSETRSSSITPSDSAAGVRKVKKTNVDVKKVSKISKEDVLKNLKDKEKKTKIILEKRVSRLIESKERTLIDKPVRCDDAILEKTLYVVASSKKSIESVKSETLKRSDRKPPIRQITSRSKDGLSDKKESGSETLVANTKTESKMRVKRIGLKATPPPPSPPTRPVSLKKGKVLEPKVEDSTLASIKFKKRVVQEPKLISDVNKNKKNLKDKGEGTVKKMSYKSGEGEREKVVLRHRKVEEKKKVQTLFNNAIEETVNKLGEERKSRVKALVGAFETVISLHANYKTSLQKKKKIQIKSVSP